MKHAGQEALDALEDLLAQVRQQPGLKEKKRGPFIANPAACCTSTKIQPVFSRI